MKRARLVAHLTVQLVEIEGDETTVLDTRQGSQGGDLDTVQRQVHLMIDAYTLALATIDQRVGAPAGTGKQAGKYTADQMEQLADQERTAAAARAHARRDAGQLALDAMAELERAETGEIE